MLKSALAGPRAVKQPPRHACAEDKVRTQAACQRSLERFQFVVLLHNDQPFWNSPQRCDVGGDQAAVVAAVKRTAVAVDDPTTAESVSLQAGKVDLEYKAQKADGSLEPGLHFKYDIKANKIG